MVELNYQITSNFIFYYGAFLHIHVTVTDCYYSSGDNHKINIKKQLSVEQTPTFDGFNLLMY
jgi:hypothetical protein